MSKFLSLVVILLMPLIFTACDININNLKVDSEVISAFTKRSLNSASTKFDADLLKLAIVPNQVVTNQVFEVQVLAENFNPNHLVKDPFIKVNGKPIGTMSLKYLQWPNTTTESVLIWSKNITLDQNQLNNIEVTSGLNSINFNITHKANLNSLTATTAADLIAKVKTALTSDSVNEIQINYDEVDLGATLDNVGNGITKNRSTWLTLKPAPGHTVSWIRDSANAPLIRRPFVNMLHLQNVIFGNDSADGAAGQWYTEVGESSWLDHCEFRAKYKYTWNKGTKLTAATNSLIRSLSSENQKIYFTNNLWDGTASTSETNSTPLARDNIFNSIRGDFNDFGKVFLNNIGMDIQSIRNYPDTDHLHNDVFQVWGNEGTSNIILKGLKIDSPHIQAEIQPFLFDRTYSPDYRNIIIDNVTINGVNESNVLCAQLAGQMTNVRISNFKATEHMLTLRGDFTEPQGAFSPTNLFLSDVYFEKVTASVGVSDTLFTYDNVQNSDDISSELSVIYSLNSLNPKYVKIKPAPYLGSFSLYQGGNPVYRTDSGSGIFINTIHRTGLSSLLVYDSSSSTYGLFLVFNTATDNSDFLADNRSIKLTVTVKSLGDGGPIGTQYIYKWLSPTGGSSGLWTSTSSVLKSSDLLSGSSAWPNSGQNLWGNAPEYFLEYY